MSAIPIVSLYSFNVAGDTTPTRSAGSGIICRRIKQSSRISGRMPGTWYIAVRFCGLQKYNKVAAKHKASIMASDHNSSVPKASGAKISKNKKIKYGIFFNEIIDMINF